MCSVKNLRQDRVFYVEASLHFGGQTLHSPLRSSPSTKETTSFSYAWDEDMEFNVRMRDIPKVSKLLFNSVWMPVCHLISLSTGEQDPPHSDGLCVWL